MECLICGQDAGYHRAVVERLRGEQRGGLCRECERREFGRSLHRGLYREREGCILCARDGHFALPLGEPVATRTETGDVESEIAYDIDESTVHLCDEHLDAIASEADAIQAGDSTLQEFW
ncbi:MAG: hypothetical protein ABEI31_00900 [Halodesulfurarchaeum sp.]